MLGTPLVFGLTMILCFTLFFYYWRIRQLRARLLAAQSAPFQDDSPDKIGIGKQVVETFPTIKACELKCTARADLQCPICLVEYEEWEVLRQLPFCGHIFHLLCVGAWFEKQTTCPVCRTSMSQFAEPFGHPLAAENTHHCRVGRLFSDVSVEAASGDTPSWIMINYRLSLPDQCCLQRKPQKVLKFSFSPLGFRMKMEERSVRLIDLTGSREYVHLDVPQREEMSCADFHAVNIPQERRECMCFKCNHKTKPVKTATSDYLYSRGAFESLHEQGDIQILVIQPSI